MWALLLIRLSSISLTLFLAERYIFSCTRLLIICQKKVLHSYDLEIREGGSLYPRLVPQRLKQKLPVFLPVKLPECKRLRTTENVLIMEENET